MQSSCDYSSSIEVSLIEDSRYAFFSSYEILKDRYNKLKGDYRNLLIRRTCCRCTTPLTQCAAVSPKNLHLNTSSKKYAKPRNHPSVDSCHSPETADLIQDFSLLRERLARVLSSSVCEIDSSALSSAVDSLYKLKRQMSFSCDSVTEDIDDEGESVKNPERTPETSKSPSPRLDLVDSGIIQEEMESLISVVNKQKEELEFLHERLQHQRGLLIDFISGWQGHRPDAENDLVDVDEWSIVLTS